MKENSTVKLSAVEKGYTEAGVQRTVLLGIDAEFYAGKFYAVQGRSGSGKSTLLQLIAGLDLPDAGKIIVAGTDITTLSERDRTLLRRYRIGFVFQFFNLIPTLTVDENLRFPLELNKFPAEESAAAISRLLEEFSLHDRRHSYPDMLSGGEQQRVAIARAIAHKPAIVLADEPTGNLDSESEAVVLQLMRRLPDQYGVTLICATHSAEVARRADHIYRINKGSLERS